MDRQPNPMPQAVAKMRPESCLPDYLPCCPVGLLCSYPGFYLLLAGKLGLSDDSKYFNSLPVRFTQHHGPGHIRAVTVQLQPHIDYYRLALLDLLIRRHCMGQGCIGPGSHNCLKSRPFRPLRTK